MCQMITLSNQARDIGHSVGLSLSFLKNAWRKKPKSYHVPVFLKQISLVMKKVVKGETVNMCKHGDSPTLAPPHTLQCSYSHALNRGPLKPGATLSLHLLWRYVL